MPEDVIIIGAGPAGLAAAIAAGKSGCAVTVLEKNDRAGRKLLVTGGGRCNLRDPAAPALDALAEYGREGAFLRDALARFDWPEFLRSLDITLELDPDDGRWYVKGGARRMLDAMLAAAEKAGVCIVIGAKVKSIVQQGGSPPIWGVALESSGPRRGPNYRGDRLILATGGITYPTTGSSGDALAWAESLGHRIDTPTPALAGLATAPCFATLTGNTVKDVELTALVGGKKRGSRRGTLLFTHGGISGPATVDLSLDIARASSFVGGDPRVPPSSSAVGSRRGRTAALAASEKKEGAHAGAPVHERQVAIDFLPEAALAAIESHLLKRGNHAASRALEGFPGASRALPSRLVLELLRLSGVDSSAPLDHASDKSLRAFAQSLKSLRLSVPGLENPDGAAVTLGGVSVKDINPKTLESRLAPGLFFAGELLSPSGPCGGFNLLHAFATGWLAGTPT